MSIKILTGDCLDVLRSMPECLRVNCCVTSPPYYGLRDYGMAGQIGLEETPGAYVARLVEVFREVRKRLTDDGTLWLNIGDSYANSGVSGPQGKSGARATRTYTAENLGGGRNGVPTGMKPKDLIGIPWMLAFALRADGWYLRQDIIWHKPNPMPESVRDRCTKAHEYVFLLSKSARYFYDAEAIAESALSGTDLGLLRGRQATGDDKVAWTAPSIKKRQDEGVDSRTAGDGSRNKRSVWSITTQPFAEAHFATMAPELAETCIKAGCPKDGTVLDPFGGAGTTGLVADRLGRNAIMIELNPSYVEIARKRLIGDAGMFAEVA